MGRERGPEESTKIEALADLDARAKLEVLLLLLVFLLYLTCLIFVGKLVLICGKVWRQTLTAKSLDAGTDIFSMENGRPLQSETERKHPPPASPQSPPSYSKIFFSTSPP